MTCHESHAFECFRYNWKPWPTRAKVWDASSVSALPGFIVGFNRVNEVESDGEGKPEEQSKVSTRNMSKEWPTGKKRVKFISLVVCGEVFSGTATPSASGIGFFFFLFSTFSFSTLRHVHSCSSSIWFLSWCVLLRCYQRC